MHDWDAPKLYREESLSSDCQEAGRVMGLASRMIKKEKPVSMREFEGILVQAGIRLSHQRVWDNIDAAHAQSKPGPRWKKQRRNPQPGRGSTGVTASAGWLCAAAIPTLLCRYL